MGTICMHVICAHTHNVQCSFAVCCGQAGLLSVYCMCAGARQHTHPLISCAHHSTSHIIHAYTAHTAHTNACVRANVIHIGRTFVAYRHVLYWAHSIQFQFRSLSLCSMNVLYMCVHVRARARARVSETEPNQTETASQPAKEHTSWHVYVLRDLVMAMAIASVRLSALLLWLCNMCECMHIKYVLETIVKINVMNSDEKEEEEEEDEQQEEVVVVVKQTRSRRRSGRGRGTDGGRRSSSSNFTVSIGKIQCEIELHTQSIYPHIHARHCLNEWKSAINTHIHALTHFYSCHQIEAIARIHTSSEGERESERKGQHTCTHIHRLQSIS